MTPTELRHLLAPLVRAHPVPPWPVERPLHDPAWRERLVALAEADPGDRPARAALFAIHALVGADEGLPVVVAGVRRDDVVRADAFFVVLRGTEVATGQAALVRTPRAAHRRDPLVRAQLARDAEVLAAGLPALRLDPDAPAIVLPLPHPPASSGGRRGVVDDLALGRVALATLAALADRIDAGLGVPAPEPDELRDAGDALQVAVLDPADDAPGVALPLIADALLGLAPGAEGPVEAWLGGWAEHPPADLAEAGHALVAVLASSLAQVRHGLVRARETGDHLRRREHLVDTLARLAAAGRPPPGDGLVGLDLEGRPILVRSTLDVVATEVPGEEPALVWDADDGLDVPAARRLVRLRGAAAPNPRLAEAHGVDPRHADRVVRWLAAALELRALRLILDATAPG